MKLRFHVYSGHGRRMSASPFASRDSAQAFADALLVDFPEDYFYVEVA